MLQSAWVATQQSLRTLAAFSLSTPVVLAQSRSSSALETDTAWLSVDGKLLCEHYKRGLSGNEPSPVVLFGGSIVPQELLHSPLTPTAVIGDPFAEFLFPGPHSIPPSMDCRKDGPLPSNRFHMPRNFEYKWVVDESGERWLVRRALNSSRWMLWRTMTDMVTMRRKRKSPWTIDPRAE